MSLNDGVQRSYQRLECFFKRHFCEEICDALRIADPCIVVGQNYDHAFKFVVLTDDVLYILANPPKNENDIELSIDLQYITDINQVHDIPDFLSGELKKNAQHLIITWNKPKNGPAANLKTSVRLGKRSPRIGSTDYDGHNKNDSIKVRSKLNHKDATESQNKDYPTKRNPKSSIRFNLDEGSCSNFAQLTTLATSITLPPSPSSRRPLPPPPPGTETTNASTVKILKRSGRQRRIQSERKFNGNADDSLGSMMTHCVSDSYLSSRTHPVSSSIPSSNQSASLYEQSSPYLSPDSRTTSSSSNKLSQSTSPNLNRSFSEKFGSLFGKNAGKTSAKDASTLLSTANNIGQKNARRNLDTKSIEEDVVEEVNEEFSIDIYLLSGESNFIPLLKSTNINSLLRITEEMEASRDKFGVILSSRVLEEFYQLKNDLLKCTNIEQAFILTKELLAGSKGSTHLKNLFWKTPELIQYYVSTLNAYLLEQDKIIVHGDRADELDYMLVIADLIMTMLFNTEISPTRNKVMFGQRGALVCKLVKLLLVKPDLPNRRKFEPLSPAAALLLAGVDNRETESEKEKELALLLIEWSDACSCLLYELIRATEQSKWAYHDGKEISLCLVTEIIENHTNIEAYLSEIINGIMRRLLHGRALLKPSAAILLFRQFSLLRFIFENSPTLLRYVADHYNEEFRYYIGSPNATSRIPQCPISSNVLQLIADVTSIIINGK